MINFSMIYGTLILAFAFVFYKVFTRALRRLFLSKAKTKVQQSNAMVVLSLWKYSFTILLIMGFIFFFGGDITGLGVWAGLMTAALGWALQKPITGIAGWIMVVIKRPFQIGDRIEIGGVKGDVSEITLTHIYLKEVGGTIASEENSGRVIMIPNSKLFEQDIINYTMQNDFILDQVVITVTYESNLDKAIKICKDATEKVTRDFSSDMPKKPYMRTFFQGAGSGIDVKSRYYVRAADRIKVTSDVTQEIFRNIKKARDIEFAYPHTEVVLRKKESRK
jgi:small-conductance mechanosensitive channel